MSTAAAYGAWAARAIFESQQSFMADGLRLLSKSFFKFIILNYYNSFCIMLHHWDTIIWLLTRLICNQALYAEAIDE